MTTTNQLDVPFTERLLEKFSNLTSGVVGFVSRLISKTNDQIVRDLGFYRKKDGSTVVISGSLLAQINALESKMEALTPDELRGLSKQFKARLADGETLDELLPEAFAACREAGKRTKGMRHYDTQMIGGMVLHQGNIAEMMTGEGKTLVATLPAFLNALTGNGVHVITVNDYLARRDCEWMLPIYSALGITAGYLQSDMEATARRHAYECDITYGTNSEFGFDYLRDNMKPARHGDDTFHPYYQQVQRGLNYAIIDEVDNILIDEARTPLIISGPAHGDLSKYKKANEIAVRLSEMEKRAQAERAAAGNPIEYDEKGRPKPVGVYFEIKEKERTCHLTDLGIREAEIIAGVESFYSAGNMEWPHLIDNSLKAHHLYHRDKQYLVMPNPESNEMSIIIIDEHTGRALFGRQWSDGLHQAVEAKHERDRVAIKQETQTLATITLQNFFKLYNKIGGMTGTAMTEAQEFNKIYKLEVIAIPTNRPSQRKVYPDLVYRSDREKWSAIVEEVLEVNKTGRPILIGTTDVAKSEKLADMLKRRGVRYELLNAKPEYVTRESEIVAQAGRRGAVTIATNMAGRGTDIILGGNAEYMAWAKLKDQFASRLDVPEDVWKKTIDDIEAKERTKEAGREVAGLGGLHIIGTERHDSRRVDLQLLGRSGRQGDPGSSKFFVSLQDDLMRLFGGEWVGSVLGRLGMEEGQAIESTMVTNRIRKAQIKVEEMHYEQRRQLLDYDEVMDTQRRRIYGKRQEILNNRNCKLELIDLIRKQVETAVDRFLNARYGVDSFAEFATNRLSVECDGSDFRGLSVEDAIQSAKDKAIEYIPTFIQDVMEENLPEEEDPKDWKWGELTRLVNGRFGFNYDERKLKQIGRDHFAEELLDKAQAAIQAVDLTDGERFLNADYGILSLIEWVQQKFLVKVELEELTARGNSDLAELLMTKILKHYREREIEFPVLIAMSTFMAEKVTREGMQKFNREGLFVWAHRRYGERANIFTEELVRTESKSKLRDVLLTISASAYPTVDETEIDNQIEEALSGAKTAELEDAKELANWMDETFAISFNHEEIVGLTTQQVRDILWNLFDMRYRPEIRRMERNLLLDHLDSTWKQHLLTMDHLRSGIGLYGVAGAGDPRIIFKREGMKAFEEMWDGYSDRVTSSVFRMQDQGEDAFQEVLWAGATTVHQTAESALTTSAVPVQNNETTSTNRSAEKKVETIRNFSPKVGRNDPCPCGSGKKYKNCHMRLANQPG